MKLNANDKWHIQRKHCQRAILSIQISLIITFVITGVIPPKSKAFCPVFKTLRATSTTTDEVQVWSPFVLTTTDFAKAVSSPGKLDEYLHPAQWVISGEKDGNDVLVVVSPYEANHLMPVIRSRASDGAHLYLYTPRTIKSMKSCDDLGLYSIPAVPAGWSPSRHLMDQLNLFSGQLCPRDYEAYIRLCRFLCLYTRDLQGEEGIETGSDRFIAPRNRPRHWQTVQTFQRTPIPPQKELMGIRRKGMCFELTHMGKLLNGRLLSEGEFRDA